MHDMDKNQHSVYLLYYHLIMVVKYRRKVISDDISEQARSLFEKIGEKLWKEAFWSQSYCLLTTGGATVDVIRRYIETQGEEDGRRKENRLRKYHEKLQGTRPASLSDAGEPYQ